MNESPPDNRSALQKKLATMQEVYHRFGAEALKDYSLSDACSFLASKQLAFRDARKGPSASEADKEAARALEMEVRDISNHLNSTLAGAGMSPLQRFVTGQYAPSTDKTPDRDKDKTKDFDRGR